MDEKIVNEILNDLYSSLEDAETQSAAILLFLKDRGLVTDETLAPYLEQAGRASDVRWRAARVRMASLLASAMKTSEASTQKQTEEQAAEKQKSAAPAAKDAGRDKNSATTMKAETSDAKQEPSVQKSQTAPEKKSEQGSEQKTEQTSERKSEQVSEQKSPQPSEPKSMDANRAEKKTEKDAA
jgi:hypothetical protein